MYIKRNIKRMNPKQLKELSLIILNIINETS